jgi:hypothetical protein
MTSRPKPKPWAVGNVAAVPLPDSTFALAQVVSLDPGIKKMDTIAYFDIRLTKDQLRQVSVAPTADHVISIQFTERRALTRGDWLVVCASPVNLAGIELPSLRSTDTPSFGRSGPRLYDTGTITLFLEAFFGLRPWDLMPALFDQLLLHPKLKPKGPASRPLTSRLSEPP